jgi:hypothetical protein
MAQASKQGRVCAREGFTSDSLANSYNHEDDSNVFSKCSSPLSIQNIAWPKLLPSLTHIRIGSLWFETLNA